MQREFFFVNFSFSKFRTADGVLNISHKVSCVQQIQCVSNKLASGSNRLVSDI